MTKNLQAMLNKTTFTARSRTLVVNIKRETCDVKITRRPDNSIPNPPLFGCFGNPYKLSDFSREECINRFRKYFYDRIEQDEDFRKAVLALQGKKLGCFCKPLACHGDVIKEYLDGYAERKCKA